MRFGTRAAYMSTRQAVDKTVFRFLRTFLVRKYLAIETKYFAAKKHTRTSVNGSSGTRKTRAND